MKRILKIVLLGVMLFSTASCGCKKDPDPITLEDAQYTSAGEGRLEYMETFDLVQSKIDSKANFVFYMYGATCSGCTAFSPILKEYAKEKGIIVYTVEVNAVTRANKELKEAMGWTPAVGIFKDGELYQNIHGLGSGQKEFFQSKEGFGSWFEKYVVLK